MNTLERLVLRGFKSIRDLELELRPLNVLVGANGAGKSNLLSFFKLLNEMVGDRLQLHVSATGRANSLLHYGSRRTSQIEGHLTFRTEAGSNQYDVRLFHGALDTLVFAEETLTFARTGHSGPPQTIVMGPGHVESELRARAEAGSVTAKVFRLLLSRCRAYQFHDTSATAAPRRYCYVGDDRWLMPDGGNVAAILYRLREQGRPEFGRIVGAIRQIVPLFGEFVLEPSGPNGTDLALNWRERDSDHVFGPHQFSDGTLRAICLATLLLQPVDDLPDLVVVDEPELGLHPAAQVLLAGLLRKVSHHRQVLVATQSVTLVDEFDPQDVVVVDREDRESVFRRLDVAELESWLEDYSLGEIWEKNVVGGGPF